MKQYHFDFLCKKQGKEIRKTVIAKGNCVGMALDDAAKQAVSWFGTLDIYLESYFISNIF